MQHFSLSFPTTEPIFVFGVLATIILLSAIIPRILKIPSLVILIVSGMLVGPNAFHLIDKNNAIDLLSTIGLLMLMFIVGLEIDLNEFHKNKHKSALFGFCTFSFPLAIAFPIIYYIFKFDLSSSILLSVIFSTHTMVAYPIISRYGISKNPIISIAAGGTLFTDTLVLICLTVILAYNANALNFSFFLHFVISIIIFFIIVFGLLPKLSKTFFNKLKNDRYAHFAYTIFVMFLCGALSVFAGLEPIVGAFFAGLMLNRKVTRSSYLMDRIEFFGQSLFIPTFLISVGMLINIPIIFKGVSILVILACFIFISCAGKWLAATFSAWVMKFSKVQRNLLYGLSGSHAAATLAVVMIGYNDQIFDDYVLNAVILLIMFSCIIATFVTERASRAIAITDKLQEDETDELTEKILIPIANPLNIVNLLKFAYYIKDPNSSRSISTLSIIPNDVDSESIIKQNNKMIRESRDELPSEDTRVSAINRIDTNPSSGIIQTAKETMTTTMVLGWPGKISSLSKFFGEMIDFIMDYYDKDLYVCHFIHPFLLHKRILIFAPKLAEKENGFHIWLKKMELLSKELSLPIVFYGTENTYKAAVAYEKYYEKAIFHSFLNFNIEAFSDLGTQIQENDLVFIVKAYRDSISYVSQMDNIAGHVGKLYSKTSIVVILPRRFPVCSIVDVDLFSTHHVTFPFKQNKKDLPKE